jgi:L-lactate dehydrogenase complex protein LldG
MDQPLGTPKAEFLASVRRSLARSPDAYTPPTPPDQAESLVHLEALAREAWRRIADHREQLTARFLDNAGLRGWKLHRAAGPEDALDYIASLARLVAEGSVVRSDQEALRELPLDRSLEELGIGLTVVARDPENSRENLRGKIVAAGLGVTGADYAVAETGSVVVVPRPGLSRLVSLVPPVHLALVRGRDLVESLDDVFLLRRLEYHRRGGDMGSYLNFITGPSRTADIEQTLVVGVHGPREVHLVFLE